MVRASQRPSDSGGQEGQNGATNSWEQGHQDTARRQWEGSLKEVWQMLEPEEFLESVGALSKNS
ncbi:hypothetical protein CRUP_015684 [Coryphaenoides rupestris]|nr:hypothetical protein CRUP_015684 [Coryphaenoides rupestris]